LSQYWLLTVLPAACLARHLISHQKDLSRIGPLILVLYGIVFVPMMPLGMAIHLSEWYELSRLPEKFLVANGIAFLALGINLLWFSAQYVIRARHNKNRIWIEPLCLALAWGSTNVSGYLSVVPGLPWLLLLILVIALWSFRSMKVTGRVSIGDGYMGLVLWPAMAILSKSQVELAFLPYLVWYLYQCLAQMRILYEPTHRRDENTGFVIFLILCFLTGNGFVNYLESFPAVLLLLCVVTRVADTQTDILFTVIASLGVTWFGSLNLPHILLVYTTVLGFYLCLSLLFQFRTIKILRASLVAGLLVYLNFQKPPEKPETDTMKFEASLLELDTGWLLTYRAMILARSLPLENFLVEREDSRWIYCNHFPAISKDSYTIFGDVDGSGRYDIKGPCVPFKRGSIPDFPADATHIAMQLARPYQINAYTDLIRNLNPKIVGGYLILWEPMLRNDMVVDRLLPAFWQKFPHAQVLIFNHLVIVFSGLDTRLPKQHELDWYPRIALESLLGLMENSPVKLRELRQALLLTQMRFLPPFPSQKLQSLALDLYYEELDGLALRIARQGLEDDSLSPVFRYLEQILLKKEETGLKQQLQVWCSGIDPGLDLAQKQLFTRAWLRQEFSGCRPHSLDNTPYALAAHALMLKQHQKLPGYIDQMLQTVPSSWQAYWQSKSLEAIGRYREASLVDSAMFTRFD